MKARSRFAIITTTFAALSLSAIAASADMKQVGGGHMHMSLPGKIVSIEGDSDAVTASESGGKVTVTIKLDCGGKPCINTKNGMRDEHFWKHCQKDKNGDVKEKDGKVVVVYPKATFVVDKSALKLPADGAKVSDKATGKLSLHGVTKDEPFTYTIKRSGSDYDVTGVIKVKHLEYGLPEAGYLGVHPGPEATVTVTFKLHEG